jgi:hypothetical protein
MSYVRRLRKSWTAVQRMKHHHPHCILALIALRAAERNAA